MLLQFIYIFQIFWFQIQGIRDELTLKQKEVTELKVKLHNARKAAKLYKKRTKENDSKFEEKYKNMLKEIQSRVDAIVAAKQIEVEENLNKIELEYRKKEKELRSKLDKVGVY